MNRIITNYLVIATLAASAVLTSCKKEIDDGKVQLLETMTINDGSCVKYTYDNQNRVSEFFMYENEKLSSVTAITYSGHDLITVIHENFDNSEENFAGKFVKNGNTITFYSNEELTYTMYLDNNEYPVRIEGISNEGEGFLYNYVMTFQYQDGNMTKMNTTITFNGEITSESSTEYKYDNKKSPFYYCRSPIWMVSNTIGPYSIQNNVIEQKISSLFNVKTEIIYEYDSAGFPTRGVMTSEVEGFGGDENTNIVEYKYK